MQVEVEGKSEELIFRGIEKRDAQELSEIEQETFAMPWSRESFWQEAENTNAEYVIAQAGGRILGYAGAWISYEEAQVTNVAVRQEYRGRGIGSAIFEEIIRRVKERGARAITLEVRVSNEAAIKLYEKYGLRGVGKRPHYYLDNDEDALIMWNTKI